MTWFGWFLWGGIALLVAAAFFFDKKFKTKAPEKSLNQEMSESEALKYKNLQNYHGGNGGGPPS